MIKKERFSKVKRTIEKKLYQMIIAQCKRK